MVLVTLVIVLIFLTVLYYYIKRIYFTLHGPISGLPPQFFFGNLLQTGVIGQNVPFNLVFLNLKAKFGDIFQYWLGPTRVVVVNHLEDVQHIFAHRHIYDQGELYTGKGSLVNPYRLLSLTESLQEDEKLEEMLSFLSAGYSTTSSALVWFIFLMSKYPHVQNKLKKEISQHGVQHLSIEQLDSLIYLDSVLREVFRFVPPVIGTVRTLIADDQLPVTGAHLSKGDQVMIPFYNLNRDERFCEGPIHPDQFYPERFLIGTNDNNNKITSVTFGGGHRQCIGQDFARFELKVICARLMQHVTFGDGGDKLNAGGYKQMDTILPKHIGVTIIFD